MIIIFLFQHCNSELFSSGEIPETDFLQYRFLKLENLIDVLLIQDNSNGNASQGKSAAALDVFYGASSDPSNLPGIHQINSIQFLGLAHFTEHMVFMGSEKYPGENDLDQFLSNHGG